MAQSVNSSDPFDPTNLRLSEEEVRRWQEARQSTIRNSKQPQKPKQLWCKFDYENQLGLARIFRVPVIALQAELYRLWFKLPNNEKSRSIELGNSVLGSSASAITTNFERSNIWKRWDGSKL
jgi:hypothetical protein